MPYRSDRLAQAFKEEISSILMRELRDVCPGFVTVTAAKVSNDLSLARIYVSVFGPPEMQHATLEKLNEQTGLVRKLIGQRMRIRKTPEISFVFDQSIEQGDRMMQLFTEIEKENAQASEPQTSDPRPQTSDLETQTSDFEPQTSVQGGVSSAKA
jgi:ribosome-binding factor A